MRKRRSNVVMVVAGTLCVGSILAACGGGAANSSTKVTGSGANASSGGVARAQAEVAKYTGVPSYPSLGQPFDASKAKNDLVYVIPIESVGFNNAIAEAAKTAGATVGVHVVIFPTTGQLSQFQAGIEAAITAHAQLIDLIAIDPAVVEPQIQQAKAAGIKVVVGLFESGNAPPPSSVSPGGVNIPYTLIGELEADYAIATKKGNVNAAVLVSEDVPQTSDVMDGIKSAFKQNCPSCSYFFVNEPVNAWPSFAQATAAAIQAHPNTNYVIPIYDPTALYAVSGIETAAATNRVQIDTYNGTPSVLKVMQNSSSPIKMDIGISADWLGYALMNQDLQLLTGNKTEVVDGVLRILDHSNLSVAGNPPSLSNGYGANLLNSFKTVWKVNG